MATLKITTDIDCSCQQVFSYLGNPNKHVELFTENIDVEILSGGIEPSLETEYCFLMTRYSIRHELRIRIEEIVSERLLRYRQIRGIFKKWVHSMSFEPRAEGGCRVVDLVEYELPLGLLGHLFNDLYVRDDMTSLLKIRLQRLVEILSAD